MSDLDTILHSAIERLASVPDDGIGELKLSRFRAPRIMPIGRAWRLGSVLLTRDGQLYRAGRTTRAIEPKQFLANKSNEAAARRKEQSAAVRGGFPAGDTVHFNVEVLEPVLVDGEWLIGWSGAVTTLSPLEGYFDERISLLAPDR